METLNTLVSGLSLPVKAGVGVGLALLPLLSIVFFFRMHTKKIIAPHNAVLRASEEPKPTKWQTLKPSVVFALKDGRPLKTIKPEDIDVSEEPPKQFFTRAVLLYILGFLTLLSPIGFVLSGFVVPAIVAPWVFFFVAFIFALNSPKKVMAERQKLFDNMYKIVSSTVGVEQENRGNVNKVIKVTKWAPDGITPLRVDILVPPTFNASGERGFLDQFNQVYGTNNAWVARSAKDGEPGWDYGKGVVHMFSVPPIPMIAPWHERYVLSEGIAWSFFPCGLGAENGVEMRNPETGKMEYVLGFDVSGLQTSEGKKHNMRVGDEITTSPMAMVAGGTGSGKAIACDTLIYKITENPS